MKNNTSKLYLTTLPVVAGNLLFPVNQVRKYLRGTGYSLRIRGKGGDERTLEEMNSPDEYRGYLRQDVPLHLSTSCDLYLKPVSWNHSASGLQEAKRKVYELMSLSKV